MIHRRVRRGRREGERERMREPLFCKKAVPPPSAKNSYTSGGAEIASPHATEWRRFPSNFIFLRVLCALRCERLDFGES